MATIFLNVYGKCSLPICRCDTVALCMTDDWNERTTNGRGIAFGRVFSISQYAIPRLPYTNQTLCCPTPVTYNNSCVPTTTPTTINPTTCNPCITQYSTPQTTTYCPTQTDCKMCVFNVEIDTTQFTIDPETETNYVPVCSDIVDISPYSCIYQKILDGLT